MAMPCVYIACTSDPRGTLAAGKIHTRDRLIAIIVIIVAVAVVVRDKIPRHVPSASALRLAQKVKYRIYYSYATYSAESSVLRNNDTRQASSSKDGAGNEED